ncbi:traB domain-containing protein isoform X2 [Pseudorca crassidens]|uniref:traB domain-containing protein isoform X2 n=1 Tax=Pseudorca crassidens TaxID=82174 RepID=UPI00352F8095
MEGQDEQPLREASTEPIVTSGGSEVVPRVLPGEPQNLCACSLGHRAGREGLGLGDLQSLWWTRGPGPPWGGGGGGFLSASRAVAGAPSSGVEAGCPAQPHPVLGPSAAWRLPLAWGLAARPGEQVPVARGPERPPRASAFRGAARTPVPAPRRPRLPVWEDGPKPGLAVPAADVDAFHLLLEMKLKRRQERPNLPRTVTELVAEDGSRVYVVGTAHFSDDSKKDVAKTIREVQPDVVVVELCQYRVSMLKMDERTLLREAKEISLEKLQQAVRQNGVMSGLMQMLLLKVSAHITEQLGMAPGGEFREAFKEASKVPFCKFHLGDRPIPVTFKRAIAALSFWQKIKLAWGLCFLSDPISKDDVERCKQKDLLEQMMAEMIGEFPDLHRTIVSERDIYLTYMLRQAARRLELPRASDAEPRKCVPSVVVGVVGMGHVPGIEKNWTTDLNIQEIMTVPPPSVCGRVSWLAAKAAFLGLLGYGLYWMGRRASSLVLSLPAAQYCLQRASEAWPHK